MVDGVAFRITTEGSASVPPAAQTNQAAATPESHEPVVTPPSQTAGQTPAAQEPGEVSGQESVGFQVCGTALFLPLLVVVGLGISRRKR